MRILKRILFVAAISSFCLASCSDPNGDVNPKNTEPHGNEGHEVDRDG
ncbi:hypothetical protein [Fulvivirga ligni]|nr:hypothetical protein [Fulvivirga ligni]UII20894.1 hypothetical protein LVD16_23920 [Fulvivirga ligni]